MVRYTKKIIKEWYEEYMAGSTLPRLSSKLKISTASIRFNFKFYGFAIRSISDGVKIGHGLMDEYAKRRLERTLFKKGSIPRNYIPIPKKKLKKLYSSGLSSLEIAKKLNVNKTTILRKLKKNNIKINEATKDRGKIKKGQAPWNKNKTGVYSIETINKIKKARLKQIFPKKDTVPEKVFEDELKKYKINYKKHISLYPICQPDFFIEPNIVIFIDGDYWHANPKYLTKRGQKKLTQAQLKNIKRDRIHNIKLLERGFIVLRFWENDIKNNPQVCLNITKSHILGENVE